MKNKLLTSFLCILSAFFLLTGCGQQEEPESLSAASSGSATEAPPEYNGTFNEDIFAQVCRDIRIADSVLTVPGTLKDCGPHFSAEFVLQDKENELLTYKLMYDGTEIGYVTYDGKAKLKKRKLKSATFHSVFFYNDNDWLPTVKVGGISIKDPPDKVPEVFGEPTEYMLDDEGFGFWLYKLRDGYYLKYTQSDGEFYKIGVSAHPVETADQNEN